MWIISLILRKIFFRRRKYFVLRMFLLVLLLISIFSILTLIFTPNVSWEEKHFVQFRRSGRLQYYLDRIGTIIEPSESPRPILNGSNPALMVIVPSIPTSGHHRSAIRQTWGQHLKTYFFIGALKDRTDLLIPLYEESEKYDDIVVFDLEDHYQNLTIKVGLMMYWILNKCPNTHYFVYKVDDDVVVNPWIVRKVLEEHKSAKLLGYVVRNHSIDRNPTSKWYIPSWLCKDDMVSATLCGGAYMIHSKYLKYIIQATKSVPMLNIEDIYYTYEVAQKKLKYELTDDHRLRPMEVPVSVRWLPLPVCANFSFTGAYHFGYDPYKMMKLWSYITEHGNFYIIRLLFCRIIKFFRLV